MGKNNCGKDTIICALRAPLGQCCEHSDAHSKLFMRLVENSIFLLRKFYQYTGGMPFKCCMSNEVYFPFDDDQNGDIDVFSKAQSSFVHSVYDT